MSDDRRAEAIDILAHDLLRGLLMDNGSNELASYADALSDDIRDAIFARAQALVPQPNNPTWDAAFEFLKEQS